MEENIEKKILVSERGFLGAVAKWSVEQSPYHRPDSLEIVLDALHKELDWFWKSGRLGYKEFVSTKELVEFVRTNLRKIPEYMLWNERKNGRQGNGFTGAGHHDDGSVTLYSAKADDDFIDLDALERNITNEILSR